MYQYKKCLIKMNINFIYINFMNILSFIRQSFNSEEEKITMKIIQVQNYKLETSCLGKINISVKHIVLSMNTHLFFKICFKGRRFYVPVCLQTHVQGEKVFISISRRKPSTSPWVWNGFNKSEIHTAAISTFLALHCAEASDGIL